MIFDVQGSIGAFKENFRDFEIIPYPNRGRHSDGAEPRERDYIF